MASIKIVPGTRVRVIPYDIPGFECKRCGVEFFQEVLDELAAGLPFTGKIVPGTKYLELGKPEA